MNLTVHNALAGIAFVLAVVCLIWPNNYIIAVAVLLIAICLFLS